MSVCRTPMKPSLRKWKKFSWLLMLNRMAGRSSQASHLWSVVTGLEGSSEAHMRMRVEGGAACLHVDNAHRSTEVNYSTQGITFMITSSLGRLAHDHSVRRAAFVGVPSGASRPLRRT